MQNVKLYNILAGVAHIFAGIILLYIYNFAARSTKPLELKGRKISLVSPFLLPLVLIIFIFGFFEIFDRLDMLKYYLVKMGPVVTQMIILPAITVLIMLVIMDSIRRFMLFYNHCKEESGLGERKDILRYMGIRYYPATWQAKKKEIILWALFIVLLLIYSIRSLVAGSYIPLVLLVAGIIAFGGYGLYLRKLERERKLSPPEAGGNQESFENKPD
ncbi:MAG: hypothetical protein M1269_00870 [Chloroflexi bacterium]|nr:hypothetical protein [Chloroflexota bacterium]